MCESEERDRRVLALYEQVVEIEQRLIPTGLHVFGRVDEERAHVDMLRMVASFDRPEQGVRSLPDLVAAARGLASYSELQKKSNEDEADFTGARRGRADSDKRRGGFC